MYVLLRAIPSPNQVGLCRIFFVTSTTRLLFKTEKLCTDFFLLLRPQQQEDNKYILRSYVAITLELPKNCLHLLEGDGNSNFLFKKLFTTLNCEVSMARYMIRI